MLPRAARLVQIVRAARYRRNAGRYAFQTKAMNGGETNELTRRQALAAALLLAVLVFVASCATNDKSVQTPEPVAAKKTVNCAERPYRNTISGTLTASLEISAYPGVCVVKGRVTGNVTVRSTDRRCATASEYVALSLEGGRIDGNVHAAGKRCVMVWLFDGGVVDGGIVYAAAGNLGFLGDRGGARVDGDVLLENGYLWATGASTTNRIDGKLACDGGRPAGPAWLATPTNWDGAGSDEKDTSVDTDGSTGAGYLGCPRSG